VRVDNLSWHPVRLGMRRVRSGAWWLSREGKVVGEVRRDGEGWVAVRGHERVHEDGRNMLIFDGFGMRGYPSFVAAALSVSRLEGIWGSSDGPQEFGAVRMVRVNVATNWYTVVTKGDERYVYEDFTIPEKLTDAGQAILRRVLTEVDRLEQRKGSR